MYILDAACGCHTGRIRHRNEDNFFFDGRILEAENNGLKHPVVMTHSLRREICLAVFDGMGGENFGEIASFTAAECMQKMTRTLKDFFIPERQFLTRMCRGLNDAVVAKAGELGTEHMGTTIAALYFSHNYVYVCNVGDSRAYRLRDGQFLQLSVDHVERQKAESKIKAPLTQNLGIDPEQFLIEPYIAKGKLQQGDRYLLCSDGLTDMLTNMEIDEVIRQTLSAEEIVDQLIEEALKRGGKDNITAIMCRIL